jgi:hypothetical protein
MLLIAFIALQQAMIAISRRSAVGIGMTSYLLVVSKRRAHSNHAEVANSIGVDIIA